MDGDFLDLSSCAQRLPKKKKRFSLDRATSKSPSERKHNNSESRCSNCLTLIAAVIARLIFPGDVNKYLLQRCLRD